VTTLLLLGTIKVAGLFVRCLFARDIALGGPFFDRGLVLVCFAVTAAVGVLAALAWAWEEIARTPSPVGLRTLPCNSER
jgi:hypothetical protein